MATRVKVAKLSPEKVKSIQRALDADELNHREIGEMLGVSRSAVSEVAKLKERAA